jgi:hypothetical protein
MQINIVLQGDLQQALTGFNSVQRARLQTGLFKLKGDVVHKIVALAVGSRNYENNGLGEWLNGIDDNFVCLSSFTPHNSFHCSHSIDAGSGWAPIAGLGWQLGRPSTCSLPHE